MIVVECLGKFGFDFFEGRVFEVYKLCVVDVFLKLFDGFVLGMVFDVVEF